MLKTRNVYIDTEVFVTNNFFESQNLKRLAEFGNEKTVSLYLTEITKNEVQSNIREEILNIQNDINNFKKTISNRGKVLKNLQKFKPYFDLPKLDIDLDFDDLCKKLATFIVDGNVSFISYELADIKEVLNNYFNQQPPFSGGKKKHEFPDAMVLSAIENWCKQNNQQIYFISNDNDFRSYFSENVLILPSLKILLDRINRQYEIDQKKVAWILAVFENNEKRIIEKINEKFIESIYNEIGYQVEASRIKILDTTLFDPALVQENSSNNEYIFQLDFDVHFTAQVTYEDHSLSFYDKEDDRYYNVEKATRQIEMRGTETAEITLEAYFEDGDEAEQANADISCVYTSIPDEDDFIDEVENDYSIYD